MFIINDPYFVEKMVKHVPDKIDWSMKEEFFGKNGFGFETIVDLRTNEQSKQLWKEFITAMSLGSASKHLSFILSEITQYFDDLKPG